VLQVESEFTQWELTDCFFSGLLAANFHSAFLRCVFSGGGLEAKPGCGLYIGTHVSSAAHKTD
jgi:hypothetical protein